MHVLRNMVEAVRAGGEVLDLQVIRPSPRVETADRFVCEIEGEPLFRSADAASAAVDDLIAQGRLVETGFDDHDVRKHYRDGADVVDDFERKDRSVPAEAIRELLAIMQPCVVRERCRLRRLCVVAD